MFTNEMNHASDYFYNQFEVLIKPEKIEPLNFQNRDVENLKKDINGLIASNELAEKTNKKFYGDYYESYDVITKNIPTGVAKNNKKRQNFENGSTKNPEPKQAKIEDYIFGVYDENSNKIQKKDYLAKSSQVFKDLCMIALEKNLDENDEMDSNGVLGRKQKVYKHDLVALQNLIGFYDKQVNNLLTGNTVKAPCDNNGPSHSTIGMGLKIQNDNTVILENCIELFPPIENTINSVLVDNNDNTYSMIKNGEVIETTSFIKN